MFPEAFLDRILCPFPYVNLHYRDGNKFCLLCLALPWMGKEIIWGQLNRAGQRDCHFPLAAPWWFFSYKGSAQASLVKSLCSFLPLPRIGLVHCFIKIKRIGFCQLVQKLYQAYTEVNQLLWNVRFSLNEHLVMASLSEEFYPCLLVKNQSCLLFLQTKLFVSIKSIF